MTVKMSPKYQVVIPEAVRKSVGLVAGSQIDVVAKGKIVYLVPVLSKKEIQDSLEGRLTRKQIREKRDRF